MNKNEILAKYMEQHNNLSKPYYENKKAKSKALGLYLTPQTLVETAKRQTLKQLPAQAQGAVRLAFNNGQHRRLKIARECDENLNCQDKPYKRFSELTSTQKNEVWQMILDEDEFNYSHQDIWANCDIELKARLVELEARPNPTIDEEDEIDELKALLELR